MRIAVFPGSFDPFTIGHLELVERISPFFDKVIMAIGVNSKKKYLFPLEQRLKWLSAVFEGRTDIEITSYTGLTTEFCVKKQANCIVRGLRNSSDFEFENSIAQFNRAIENSIETLFISTRPELSHISSSIVREIVLNNGDARAFVPKQLFQDFSSDTIQDLVSHE